MRCGFRDVLPQRVRRSLIELGHDLGLARRKRRLTAAMMAERLAVTRATYGRVEKGDPSVAVGIYAMALFVLGLGEPLAGLAAPGRDEQGLLLDDERVPRRVYPRKAPVPR